jgi:hypothetical protein
MDLLDDMIRADSHGNRNCEDPCSSDFPPHSTRICFLGRQRFIVAVVASLDEWRTPSAA